MTSEALPSKTKNKAISFPFDLVAVYWEDAHSNANWVHVEDVEMKPCIAITVGFVYKQDDERIMIIDSLIMGEENVIHTVSGSTVIPAGMIRDIKVIKKGKG